MYYGFKRAVPSAADPEAPPPKEVNRTELKQVPRCKGQHEDVRKSQQQNSSSNSTCTPGNGIAHQLDLRDEKVRALVLDNLEPSHHRNYANLFHLTSPSMRLRSASTETKSFL